MPDKTPGFGFQGNLDERNPVAISSTSWSWGRQAEGRVSLCGTPISFKCGNFECDDHGANAIFNVPDVTFLGLCGGGMRSNIILDFKNGRDGLQHPTCEYFKEGYDLDKASGTSLLQDLLQDRKPKHVWVSLKCTRLSSLNNLTQRDEEEEAAFQKRQARDLKRAQEVAGALDITLSNGDDFSWEWPSGASKGWNSRAIQQLQRLAHKHHRHLFWCHFHGCAHGLEYNSFPVQKSWTVVTTCREVWLALQRRCPGHENHVHCRGPVAQASSMLVRDRASGLVMVDMLQKFGGEDEPAAWEPNTEIVIKVFAKWMMHNPAPKWILTDSATYFTSQRMMDFAGSSGIGLLPLQQSRTKCLVQKREPLTSSGTPSPDFSKVRNPWTLRQLINVQAMDTTNASDPLASLLSSGPEVRRLLWRTFSVA